MLTISRQASAFYRGASERKQLAMLTPDGKVEVTNPHQERELVQGAFLSSNQFGLRQEARQRHPSEARMYLTVEVTVTVAVKVWLFVCRLLCLLLVHLL